MYEEVGSRGYNIIDFKDTALLSGVDKEFPLHHFKSSKTLILRSDFTDFCIEYLAYKFGVTIKSSDLALVWSVNDWKFPNNKVYRPKLTDDINTVVKTLESFKQNFDRADVKKISY